MKKFLLIIISATVALATLLAFTSPSTKSESYVEYHVPDYYNGSISTDSLIEIYKLLPIDFRNDIRFLYMNVVNRSDSNFTYKGVKVERKNNDWYFYYKDASVIAHNIDLEYLSSIILRSSTY